MSVRLASNESSIEQVLKHLQSADALFIPPLSRRVDLPAYASKLCERAAREEAWFGNELVALVATYCNDPAQGAYVSNVSVLPAFRGQGLADELLKRAIAHARARRLHRAQLHLHRNNAAALALYLRHGFALGPADGDQLTMNLNLDRP